MGRPEFVVLAGLVLGAGERGRAVVVDGLATSVAALCAVKLSPGVAAHLVAGQRSREMAHGAVLEQLGLEPLLDLRMRAGEGVGAVLSCQLLAPRAANEGHGWSRGRHREWHFGMTAPDGPTRYRSRTRTVPAGSALLTGPATS